MVVHHEKTVENDPENSLEMAKKNSKPAEAESEEKSILHSDKFQENLDEFQKLVNKFDEEVLHRANDEMEKVDTAVTTAETVMDMLEFTCELVDQAPVVGGAISMLTKIMKAVKNAKGVAEDVLQAGHNVVDYTQASLLDCGREGLALQNRSLL